MIATAARLTIVAALATEVGCRRDTPALACAEHLVAPNYPAIGVSARITISGVSAVVSLDRGRVEGVRVTFPAEAARFEKLFRPAVEGALRRSRFSPDCPDATVAIVYDFVLAEDTDRANPDPPSTQRVAFRPPNRVVVSMTGALIDVSARP